MRHQSLARALTALVLALVALQSGAQDLAAFEKKLTVRTLDNGLMLMIFERPVAPIVSFYTHVDVGSAQEVWGITGLAHMFEHMAFKGTTRIGTTNYAAEQLALEKVDRAYHARDAERSRSHPDEARLEELQTALTAAQEEAREYVVPNEFGEIIDRAGGSGLNASTSNDATDYRYSLPANKVELWAYLETERFLDPVLREFYKERDVVMEERRMRVESSPVGRLLEQFLATAFIAHPYQSLGIGFPSDLRSFTREDAEAFYRKYYTPANMVISVVGDVDTKTLLPMLERYFSRLPEGEPTPLLRTVEPPSIAERTVRIPDPSQPIYLEGYHRPAVTDPDNAVYDAISDVLSTGRTSRLYRSLVRDKKLAAQSAAFNGFPGDKYPNLMIFFAVPTPGSTNEQVQEAIRAEIERLKTEPISDDELQMVKTRAKASLIRGLRSNSGLASQLAYYQRRFGDWRELFHSVERIEQVTKEDILRVARATFVTTNRTVGMIDTNAESAN